ncbi:IS607 family transposase [Actinopolymorpha pittospori]|uniref:Site-specific integrase-resolvase n=2 Tax=Actinopolymorpha pittospori TaxID=648752 RepID=A0A927RF92_9ACTN|nr:putative site-specific integrase-resolvase [Actinopolymorpha pittospori]
MNLKEWAASQGVSYATALRWYKAGKLPVPAYQAGRLIVIGEPGVAAGRAVAVYARVCSSDQSVDLDRQVAWVSAWATTNGYQVGKVVTEIGSALDGKRPKFLALLRDPSVSTIIVERRDRIARFGAEYVEAALAASGRRLVVADPSEVDEDLVRDVTQILTSLCARAYGRRGAANRAASAVAALCEDPA